MVWVLHVVSRHERSTPPEIDGFWKYGAVPESEDVGGGFNT